MEPRILELEKDVEKAQFQQELSKWFESRGIIADLRSHLRHLMVLALQSTQTGVQPTCKSSPKAQAINLMIAEYLFRHRCHYALSVFTSEVPTLANFHPDVVFQGRRTSDVDKRRSLGKCFQENEVEEIFSALGMSSGEEELTLLKARYLSKSNDFSLVELFLQSLVEMSTKLVIRQNLKSHAAEGERLLSKEWSWRIVNILLNEKIASPQIAVLEEAIFRTTEGEIRRILDEERKLQMLSLSERERRIQEHLKKHENEILLRLKEAEKELTTREDAIVVELSEREERLTKIIVEWRNKHEEILKLSTNFYSIANENKDLQKKLKAFEEENINLKTQGKAYSRIIDDLREEINSLINKIREVTDSNATLSERIQALISRENEKATVHQKNADQNSTLPHPDEWNLPEPNRRTQLNSGGAEIFYTNPTDEEDVLLSSSSEEIILSVRKRLQDLEEETNRINHNYLEYKLKCVSVESDLDSLRDLPVKSPPNILDEIITKETKFSQTDTDDTFIKIQKLKELTERKIYFPDFLTKKSEQIHTTNPTKFFMRTPTKRQLQHRDFFLKSRQLLQFLERQNHVEDFYTNPSIMKSFTSSFDEELTESYKKSPLKSNLSTPLSATSAYIKEVAEAEKPQIEREKKMLVENSNHLLNEDLECLALLEETRIKSPKITEKKSLRQNVLWSEAEKSEEINENCFKSIVISPVSSSSKKLCEKSESDDFCEAR